MNKEDNANFKELFNKVTNRLLDTLNNNPNELFEVKKISKQLADKSRQIYKLTKENTNLKQALNKIKDKIKDKGQRHQMATLEQTTVEDFCLDGYDCSDILQIIDKVLGDDEK